MTDATWFLEVASYALITAFGAWLLWRKLGPTLLALVVGRPAYSLSAAHAHSHRDHHAIASCISIIITIIITTMPMPAASAARGLRDLRPFACARSGS